MRRSVFLRMVYFSPRSALPRRYTVASVDLMLLAVRRFPSREERLTTR
jgi:hypothetical protein